MLCLKEFMPVPVPDTVYLIRNDKNSRLRTRISFFNVSDVFFLLFTCILFSFH